MGTCPPHAVHPPLPCPALVQEEEEDPLTLHAGLEAYVTYIRGCDAAHIYAVLPPSLRAPGEAAVLVVCRLLATAGVGHGRCLREALGAVMLFLSISAAQKLTSHSCRWRASTRVQSTGRKIPAPVAADVP
jgi:hypothetical protein